MRSSKRGSVKAPPSAAEWTTHGLYSHEYINNQFVFGFGVSCLDRVNSISKFLNNQRKSRIKSTHTYLLQIYQSLQGGDLPLAVRNQLEDCERDLIEIQEHLFLEYKQIVDKKTEHADRFGTKKLTKNISIKMQDLELLAADMALCINTRIVAWHVLSLFPGESQLKLARRGSIKESIDKFVSLAPYLEEKIKKEIFDVNSFWNSENTLKARKDYLSNEYSSKVHELEEKARQAYMCRVPDDWLLANRAPLLQGREALRTLIAEWKTQRSPT